MKISSKVKDFTVKFVDNFNFVNEFLSIPHYAVVVGSNVYRIYKKNIFSRFPKENIIVIPFDEERKTIETAIDIYKKLLEKEGKKNLTLISFGGGINQDVTGFVASTLYRGINWIYVPTTLLAMADSSVGLKTSLNFEFYKNILGTFYPPSEVFIAVDFLKTLEKKDYASGVGEIMKLLLMRKNAERELGKIREKIQILDAYTDKRRITDIIKEAIQIKLSYMKGDEFDHGRRNLLNYGHELGHALEPASGYEIPHGIAVVVGMIFANYISVQRNWMEKKIFHYLNEKLFLPYLTSSMVELKKEFFNATLLTNMKKDKKRESRDLVLILPKENLNLCKVQNLTIQEFEEGLTEVRKILKV